MLATMVIYVVLVEKVIWIMTSRLNEARQAQSGHDHID